MASASPNLVAVRDRPFLEGEPAVTVGVEPGEGAAAGLEQLLERDPAVIVAVGAVEAALLLACARRPRAAAPARPRDERRDGPAGGGGHRIVLVLGQAGPDEEAGRHQQQADPTPAKNRSMPPSLRRAG